MENIVLFSIIILATIFLTRFLERKQILSPVHSRKLLHIVAIGLSATSVFYISIDLLLVISLGCLPILVFVVSKGFFRDAQTKMRSWGIVYFNAVFALLLYLFPQSTELIFYPLFILALADGLAAAVGVSFAKGNQKTIQGFATFFVVTLAVFTLAPLVFNVFSLPLKTALILSFLLAVTEFITKKSLDNITVPMATVYWLYVDHLSHESIIYILAGIIAICWITYKFKWLDPEGAMLAGIFALVYLSSPFPTAAIPAVLFFVLGSLLSKLPGTDSKEDTRNVMQVFSNGGPAIFTICIYFISNDYSWLLASTVSFSVAMSDTASSELGMRFSSKTFDILGLKKIKKGASGGVSIVGFIAGILASCFLAFTTSVFIDLTLVQTLLIALLGFGGNLLDSFIGSTIQSKSYHAATGLWSDEANDTPFRQAGVVWFDNNLTNLLSIGSVTFLSYFAF